MRKTKDILRLSQEAGLANRQIARSLNISATTVGECLKRAREAQITWPLPEGMDDEVLEKALYGETEAIQVVVGERSWRKVDKSDRRW